jgi:hypothetical protein
MTNATYINKQINLMAFTSFHNLAEVIITYNLVYEEQLCKVDLVHFAPQTLHDEIQFNRQEIPYQNSEIAIGEIILFPIFKVCLAAI